MSVEIPLVLDGTEIIAALGEIKAQMTEISKKAGLTQTEIQEAFDKGSQEAEQYRRKLSQAVHENQALIKAANETALASKNYDEAAQKVGKLEDELESAKREISDLNKKLSETGKKAKQGTDEAGKSINSMGAIAKRAGLAVIGFFAVDKILNFGRAVFQATAQFQKFEAQLKVALGSKSEARASMAMLSEFAKKTPYELAELTEAYVKFANRGIKLTTEQLTKIGDLAASQGKSFMQLTEAILDAGSGEYERLKEFGIKASAMGDKVALSFKGKTVEVKKSEQAIQDAIIAMGAYNGIAGGMAEQSATLGGKLSNVQDAMSQLANTIGQKLAPVFSDSLDAINSLISGFNDLIKDKSLEELRSEFDAQIQSTIALEKTVLPLVKRYEELEAEAHKVGGAQNLNKEKHEELNRVMNDIVNIVPEAATEFDKYGNVISIAKDKVYDFVEAQRQALTFKNKDLIADLDGQIQSYATRVQIISKQLTDGFKLEAVGQELKKKILSPEDRAAMKKELDELKGLQSGAEAYKKELNGDFIKGLEERKKKEAEQREADAKQREAEAKKREDARKAVVNAEKMKAQAERLERERLAKIRESLALERELQQARIEMMAEGREKELAIENEKNRSSRIDLNFRLQTTTDPDQREKIHQLLELEEERHQKAVTEINKRYIQEQIKLKEEADAQFEELTLKGKDAELAALNRSTTEQLKAVAEKYKNDLNNRMRLTAAIMDQQAKQEAEIEEKYALEGIDRQEQLALLQAQIDIKNETAREMAIIQIRQQFAQAKLDQLNQNKTAENEVERKQLELTIQNLNTEAEKFTKDESRNPFNKLVKGWLSGLSKAGGGDGSGLDEFMAQMGNIISGAMDSAFEAMQAGADRLIAERQRVVDSLTEQISDVEEALNKEKELQEQGFANNVGIRQKELEDLKSKRDQALRDQQEAIKRKQNLQKLELAVDSTYQLTNMITAASDIFKSAHKIFGIFGTPIAVALTGLMFGSFAAQKVAAFRAINSQKFADGGVAGGRSHAEGGNKYISLDGNDPDVIEIEKGEYITNKNSTKKYMPLLEAINSDELSNMTFGDLMNLIDPKGARMKDGITEQTVQLSKQAAIIVSAPHETGLKQELTQVNEKLGRMLELDEEKAQTEDHGEYIIIKKGSLTRKIKK